MMPFRPLQLSGQPRSRPGPQLWPWNAPPFPKIGDGATWVWPVGCPTDVSPLHFGKHAARCRPMGSRGKKKKVRALVLPSPFLPQSLLFYLFSAHSRPARPTPTDGPRPTPTPATPPPPSNRLGRSCLASSHLPVAPFPFSPSTRLQVP